MFRTRLASLVLAGSLLTTLGCSTMNDWMRDRPRLFNRHRGTPDCEEVCVGGPTEGIGSAQIEGPHLFPQSAVSPAPFPGTMQTLPVPNQFPTNQAPRIVTVPQAAPMPSPP